MSDSKVVRWGGEVLFFTTFILWVVLSAICTTGSGILQDLPAPKKTQKWKKKHSWLTNQLDKVLTMLNHLLFDLLKRKQNILQSKVIVSSLYEGLKFETWALFLYLEVDTNG